MSALQLLTGYLPFYLDGTLCLNSDMCQFIHCKRKLQLIAAALPAARADCSSSIFGIRIPRKYLFCYKIPKRKIRAVLCLGIYYDLEVVQSITHLIALSYGTDDLVLYNLVMFTFRHKACCTYCNEWTAKAQAICFFTSQIWTYRKIGRNLKRS